MKYEQKTFPEVENIKIYREAKASMQKHPKRNYLKRKKLKFDKKNNTQCIQVKKAQSKHFNYIFLLLFNLIR